jgi:phospholipid/cholesterol/gamma-HCH transport system substrate-binding protein
METKANYVIVGLFTIIAIVAAFGFVYWTATIGGRGAEAKLRVLIHGSAAGVGPGSLVLFNGVKVGLVNGVHLDVNDPTLAIADTTVDRLTPITKSTKANIAIAGLTGQSNIELRGANVDEPNLLDLAEEAGGKQPAEITAEPSAVSNLLETAQDIFTKADKVLSGLQGFVDDVRQPLTNTVNNAEKFSQALADNSQGVDEFLASVTKLSSQLAGASDKLESALDAADTLLRSVDRNQVRHIVDNVETVTKNLADASDQVDDVVRHVDDAVVSLTEFSNGARQTLAKVDKVVESVDPQTLHDAIANIEVASRSANEVLADVSKVTGRFADHAEDVDKILADVTELAGRLNQASSGLDDAVKSFTRTFDGAQKTLANVDDVLAAVDPKAVRDTIDNIAAVSDKARGIVDDVSKVTTRLADHAGDVDKIMADATELTDRLSHASLRVDGILRKVDDLLGSGEAKGLAVQASETLKSFKQVADTLNSRLGTITDGLARFSNQGLREVEAFVVDGRRTLVRIGDAVSDFANNPQRILSGGEGTVREFSGRARR